MESIKLRPTTIQDADMLLAWRNDPETREASHSTAEVSREGHIIWLTKALNNPNRQLFISEENGIPVGAVRADFSDGVYELSWTVAPHARGRGVAKQMVGLLARQITGPIRAEVKLGNVASAHIAEHAGMTFDGAADNIQHFSRPALKDLK